MMREMRVLGMVSIHVGIAVVVVIAILHRVSSEVWMTQVNVVVVVRIGGRVRVELHDEVRAVAAAAAAASTSASSSCPFRVLLQSQRFTKRVWVFSNDAEDTG